MISRRGCCTPRLASAGVNKSRLWYGFPESTELRRIAGDKSTRPFYPASGFGWREQVTPLAENFPLVQRVRPTKSANLFDDATRPHSSTPTAGRRRFSPRNEFAGSICFISYCSLYIRRGRVSRPGIQRHILVELRDDVGIVPYNINTTFRIVMAGKSPRRLQIQRVAGLPHRLNASLRW